jgi:hypothetical protein
MLFLRKGVEATMTKAKTVADRELTAIARPSFGERKMRSGQEWPQMKTPAHRTGFFLF